MQAPSPSTVTPWHRAGRPEFRRTCASALFVRELITRLKRHLDSPLLRIHPDQFPSQQHRSAVPQTNEAPGYGCAIGTTLPALWKARDAARVLGAVDGGHPPASDRSAMSPTSPRRQGPGVRP